MKLLHRLGCVRLLVLVLGAAAMSCSDDGGGTSTGARDAGPATVTLVAVAVTPPAATLAKGTVQQFTATGTYSDGTTKNLTTMAAWTSSAATVATVGAATGKATGAGVGTAVVTATFMSKSGSANLTVTAAELTALMVSPSSAMLAPTTTAQLMALATFGDGTMQEVTDQVSWNSDTQSVATVTGGGLVTGVSAGTAAVTATMEGKMATSIIMVSAATLSSITLAPSTATIAKGTTQAFLATATFSDGHTQDLATVATWTVTPPAVAMINTTGVATGVGGGQATITAAFMDKTATATLTVTEARLTSLAITPANPSIVKGASKQFTATGTFTEGPNQDLTNQVTWASDPMTVASISNAAGSHGLASGLTPGRANIGATFSGIVGTTTLAVTSAAPLLNSFTPTTGPQDGGTTVTLTGSGFTGATSVKFGTTLARSFSVVSDTQVTAITPAGHAVASVIVATPAGTSNALYYTYLPPPSLGSLSPVSGPQAGGTTVTLTGTGFTGATAVSFGTTAAMAFMVVSDTTITALSPPGLGGVNVTVTTPLGQSGRVAFAYGSAPSVGGINPTSGAESGGTAVTITGTGLTNVAAVRFGSASAVSFNQVSATTITAVAPPGVGSVNVSVTNDNGNSNGLVFTYRSAPSATDASPAAGPFEGGNTIIIRGAGFTGVTGVSFGGTAAQFFTVVSDTEITAVAPAGTGNQQITVTSPLGTSAGIAYSYGPRPTLGELTPSSGPLTGGIMVTLTGSGFTQAQGVFFDAQSLSFTVLSDTEITVVIPAGIGSVNVKVVNPFAESTTLPFSYGPSPGIISLTPAAGPEPSGTSVVIAGTAFTGATAVKFGLVDAVSFIVNNDSQITAVAPAATGVVLVTVTTPFATSNPAPYTHIAPPAITSFTPTSGPILGGTVVSITGTSFGAATMVLFGATPATSFTFISGVSLLATAPAGVGTATITVITPNGMNTSSTSFTYIPASVVSGVSPTTGPESGAVTVTLTGTNFTGATAVAFGVTPATSFTVNSDTQIVATIPAGTGTLSITVTTPSGTGTGIPFTYVPAPSISSLTPTFGPEPGGTSVVIAGSLMLGTTAVKFGSVDATSFTVNSASMITAVAPAGTGVKAVTVTNTYGTSNSQPFTYGPVPTTSSLSRTQGATRGSQTVIITGTGFTGASAVTFGATPAITFNVDIPTQITATSPVNLVPGAQSVTVTTPYGTSNGQTFTYGFVPAIGVISPTTGSNAGGTTVTVTGAGFLTTTAVTFGALDATSFVAALNTSLTAVAPAALDGPVSLTVTNVFGTSDPTTYTYGPSPTVSGVSPTQGGTTGGTSVTITGTHLSGTTAVSFGANPATSFTNDSPTQVTAVAPAGLTGTVAVNLTTPYGTSSTASFTYGPAPTITAPSPDTSALAGGGTVTITGTGFVMGSTTVTFGVNPGTAVNVSSSTSLTVDAPAGPAGSATLTVTTPFGSGTSTFTYVAPPTVSALSVNTGPATGGTPVTITGTDLSTTTGVTFGGVAGTGLTLTSNTSITVTSPAGTGAVSVVVTTAYGTDSAPPTFTYIPAPTISLVSPNVGATAGGNTITITGTTFITGMTTVHFGPNSATATVGSPTSLTVTAPAGIAPGLVPVTVTTPSGTSGPLPYTYYNAPSISTVVANAGPSAGGDMVTIGGSNFTGTTSVTFDGVEVTSLVVMNAAVILVTTPAGSPGAVDVVVTNPGGSATASSAYTYVAAPGVGPRSPNAGSTAGGTTVTLTGTNLAATMSVTIGGVPATITSNTPTQVNVTTGAHAAGVVDIVLTTIGGTGTIVGGYTYILPPTITMINPVLGNATSGGDTVVITGTDFNTTSSVSFGTDQATSFTVDSDTQITAHTAMPTDGAGDVDVSVTTAADTATTINGFRFVNAPGTPGPSPNTGSLGGGETITITGAFLNYVTQVLFGATPVTSLTHVSPTQITVVAPAHAAGTVSVSLLSPGGTDSSTSYRYMAAPTITMIAPSSAVTSGGISVVITGTNFQAASAVTFDGSPVAALSVDSDTQITVTTPAHSAAGAVDVVITAPGGMVTSTGGFTYTAPSCTDVGDTCIADPECCSHFCNHLSHLCED